MGRAGTDESVSVFPLDSTVTTLQGGQGDGGKLWLRCAATPHVWLGDCDITHWHIHSLGRREGPSRVVRFGTELPEVSRYFSPSPTDTTTCVI
jgi:hypothetical protein